MNYKIYDEKKEVIYECDDKIKTLASFTSELFNKYILKDKSYKQVQYKYNYNDNQEVTFIFKNNFRVVYQDIPTKTRIF